MSSFVNDNVSESKTLEQQINENQEQSAELATDVTTATTTNQIENTTTAAKIIDINIESKVGETIIEQTKTIKENQSEQIEKNPTTGSAPQGAAILERTIAIAGNYDDNKAINDGALVATVVDKDKTSSDASQGLASSVGDDTRRHLNPIDDNSLLAALKVANPTIAPRSAPSMKQAADEQQQTQQKLITDSRKATEKFSINTIENEASAATALTLTATQLIAEVDKLPMKSDINLTSLKISAVVTHTSPLPSLPPGLTSSLAGSHLPHISSDPTFGVQLRNTNSKAQQHNTNINNSKTNNATKVSFIACTSPAWRPDTSVPNFSTAIKCGTVSATVSPSMVRKTSDSSVLLPRRVSFPKSDNELVTGYLEPANPWEHGKSLLSMLLK